MRTWDEYKNTFGGPSIFDFAREGDLLGFAELLQSDPQLDLNQKNHRGYSPLMLAVYNGQEIFSEALLRAGADPNSVDSVGSTILMGASFKGNIKLIELLLNYGARLDFKNDAGMSAFDWAKTFGRKEAMEYYKKRGEKFSESSLLKNYLRMLKLSLRLILKKGR